MNMRWSTMLKLLRNNGIPFTTTIECGNVEVLVLQGEYVESFRWNKMSIIDQSSFLKRIGLDVKPQRYGKYA